jgi:hydroxymethylpyrimidine/phosphomethylpyrimidine kinase
VSQEPPVALTIAGSDSGAGAGIQADIKTMGALGVLATTAITTVTAQNTAIVDRVHHLPADLVDAQITAVLDDLPVTAVKTGLLGTVEVIEAVGRRASAGDLPNLVVDPVMVSSSGRQLLDGDGVDAYRRFLLPHSLIVTPNLWEAAMLAGTSPTCMDDVDSMVDVARTIHAMGPRWVLVKGGHLESASTVTEVSHRVGATDVLYDGRTVTVLSAPWVDTPNTHGTGCSLSAAIAARLSAGVAVAEAVDDAKRYVHAALIGAAPWRMGAGHGPLDHFGVRPAMGATAAGPC